MSKKVLLSILLAMVFVQQMAPLTTFAAEKSPIPQLKKEDISVYSIENHVAVIEDCVPSNSKYNSVVDAVNDMNAKLLDKAPSNLKKVGQVLLKHNDDTKYYITVYDKSTISIDKKYYSIAKDSYEALEYAAKSRYFAGRPRWLVHMNPARITDISYTNTKGKTIAEEKENLLSFARMLGKISVNRTGAKAYKGSKDFKAGADKIKFTIKFNSGVVYTIWIMGETDRIYVESSDMSYGIVYDASLPNFFMDDIGNFLIEKGFDFQNWIPMEEGPLTGKPVIYLYPQKTQDISVKLDFDGELSYTFPTYNNGWNVTATPDGTLTNKSDKSTHYYLFWDGTANRKVWDFEDGFFVETSQLETFFKEKLPKLGLTPKEYNDFITYWVPKLSSSKYHLIRFATTEYTDIAKLGITPTPDTVLRVHMVYKPVDASSSVKEQVLPVPPERLGFTVVEWGGTLSR